MKIGIIGPDRMAMTWEQHLRSVSGVREVVIAPKISILNDVDACLILSDDRAPATDTGELMEAVKRGYHILRIAPLPTNPDEIHSWHEASEESGVIMMFSMWSHYSPATRWLFNHISTPRKIHVHREWAGPKFTPDAFTLYRIFLEEISLCLEWTGSRPVSFEGDMSTAPYRPNEPHKMQQLFIRFANGTTASILLNPFGLENRHSRFVTGDKMAAVCQINEHLIKKWLLDGQTAYTPEVMRFEYREPAHHLLSHFMRAIQTGKKPLFGIRELNQLASLVRNFPSG